MAKGYYKLDGFIEEEDVEKFLSETHIIKDVSVKFKVQYADMHPGGEIIPTGKYTMESRTFRVAIPKETPDLEITEENYGDYYVGVVFKQTIFKRLINLLTQ
jgi:hypothetical protein